MNEPLFVLIALLLGSACVYLAIVLWANIQQYALLSQGIVAIPNTLYQQLQTHFQHHDFAVHIMDAKRRCLRRCYHACGHYAIMLLGVTALWLHAKGLLVFFDNSVAWLTPAAGFACVVGGLSVYHLKYNRRTPVAVAAPTAYTEYPHHAQQVMAVLHHAGYPPHRLKIADELGWNASCVHAGKHAGLVLGGQIVQHLKADEQAAVVAHELGHKHERHPLWLAWFRFGADVAFAAGVFSLAAVDAIALPALVAFGIGSTFFVAYRLFTAPAYNFLARYCETRADNWAVRATAAVSLLAALQQLYAHAPRHLASCHLFYWFYFSHPAPHQRLLRLHTAS